MTKDKKYDEISVSDFLETEAQEDSEDEELDDDELAKKALVEKERQAAEDLENATKIQEWKQTYHATKGEQQDAEASQVEEPIDEEMKDFVVQDDPTETAKRLLEDIANLSDGEGEVVPVKPKKVSKSKAEKIKENIKNEKKRSRKLVSESEEESDDDDKENKKQPNGKGKEKEKEKDKKAKKKKKEKEEEESSSGSDSGSGSDSENSSTDNENTDSDSGQDFSEAEDKDEADSKSAKRRKKEAKERKERKAKKKASKKGKSHSSSSSKHTKKKKKKEESDNESGSGSGSDTESDDADIDEQDVGESNKNKRSKSKNKKSGGESSSKSRAKSPTGGSNNRRPTSWSKPNLSDTFIHLGSQYEVVCPAQKEAPTHMHKTATREKKTYDFDQVGPEHFVSVKCIAANEKRPEELNRFQTFVWNSKLAPIPIPLGHATKIVKRVYKGKLQDAEVFQKRNAEQTPDGTHFIYPCVYYRSIEKQADEMGEAVNQTKIARTQSGGLGLQQLPTVTEIAEKIGAIELAVHLGTFSLYMGVRSASDFLELVNARSNQWNQAYNDGKQNLAETRKLIYREHRRDVAKSVASCLEKVNIPKEDAEKLQKSITGSVAQMLIDECMFTAAFTCTKGREMVATKYREALKEKAPTMSTGSPNPTTSKTTKK